MEPFIGMICAFGFNFAPYSWATCSGQLVSISENTALFSLLGSNFGGDGRTTLGLPDLRGRVMIGMGQGPGLNPKVIGQKSGWETGILNETQMPAHTHNGTISGGSVTIKASAAAGVSKTPVSRGGKNVLSSLANENLYGTATPDVPLNVGGGQMDGTITTSTAGGGQPFNIMQPYTAINYCIALQGLYPPRN